MAVCTLTYFNRALVKMTDVTVIIPERDKMTGPFATFYLLHGFSDNQTAWTRRTSIERYAEDLPLIIVMPDGNNSFYSDAVQGPAAMTAITQDLIGFIDRTFHTDPRREARVIGGLSMGGYGALKLALSRPDLFCSAVSHSGAMAWGHKPYDLSTDWGMFSSRITGAEPQGGPHDLFALIEKVDRAALPALRIDCGTDDFLIQDNREFHAHLETLDVPHEYAEHPGAHTWSYWDNHIQDTLAFHTRILGLTPVPQQ